MSKNCTKGYECGDSCISKSKDCPSKLPNSIGKVMDLFEGLINKVLNFFKPKQPNLDELKKEYEAKKAEREVSRKVEGKENLNENLSELTQNDVEKYKERTVDSLPKDLIKDISKQYREVEEAKIPPLKDIVGVIDYTRESNDVNNYLRIEGEEFDKNLEAKIRAIDDGLEIMPTEEATLLYRGIRNGSRYMDMEVGETFKDKGYMSTSVDRVEAEAFGEGMGGTILMELKLKEGKGKRVSGLNAFGENETLLPRGLEFKLVKKTTEEKDGRNIFYLEEI